jgi:hypothetical protein
MSEPEKFVDRWSRRKREAAGESAPGDSKAAAAPPGEGKTEEVSFDPASLPPLDSITVQTDISAFLKPGVPPELARAALRRVWSTDPAIRDFIGPVENAWDFNDPNGVPGFGPIDAGDVARLLEQVMGAPPKPAAAQKVASIESERGTAPADAEEQLPQDKAAPTKEAATPENDFVQRNEGDAASRNDLDAQKYFPPSRGRRHGGALPK